MWDKEAKSPFISFNKSHETSLFEQCRSYVILDIWFERAGRFSSSATGEEEEEEEGDEERQGAKHRGIASAFADAVNLFWHGLIFETKAERLKQQLDVDFTVCLWGYVCIQCVFINV